MTHVMTAGVELAAGAPASGGERALAYLIDVAAVVGLSVATWPSHRSAPVVAVLVVELAVVLCLASARTGRSPGSLAMRIAAARLDSDHAPGLARQARRSLVLGALHVTVVGPLLTLALSREGQDWVDRFCGTASYSLRLRPAPVVAGTDAYGRPTSDPSMVAARRVAGDASPNAPTRPPARAALPETPAAPSSAAQQQPGPASFAPPGQAVAGSGVPMTPIAGFALVIDTGERVPLRGVLVLGREPTLSGDPTEVPVVVDDNTSSVSRTHIRLGLGPDGVWAEDAYSANGTVIAYPDGRRFALAHGARTIVPVNSTLFVGDRRVFIADIGDYDHWPELK